MNDSNYSLIYRFTQAKSEAPVKTFIQPSQRNRVGVELAISWKLQGNLY